MEKAVHHTVDEYLQDQPEAARAVLQEVRQAIHEALPGLEEGISYRIPVFRLGGRVVLYFAGFRKHYSLFPVNAQYLARLDEDPARFRVNDKGTLQLSYADAVPLEFIRRLVCAKAADVAARAEAVKGKQKAR